MSNRFKKGSGAFPCEHCARVTRDTGDSNTALRLCAHCYDGAGFDNEALDASAPEDIKKAQAEARACYQLAVDAGGKIAGYF